MAYTGVASSAENLADLWNSTKELRPFDGVQYLLPLHHFEVCDYWLKQAAKTSTGGVKAEFDVTYRENGSAAWVKPGAVRTPTLTDCTVTMSMPFVGLTCNYSITDTELNENAGPAKMWDLLPVKRNPAIMDALKELESRAWEAPEDSADAEHARGVPYHVTPIVSGETAGFNGDLPFYKDATEATTYQDIDVSSSTYSRIRNYNDRWTNDDGDITEEDMEKLGNMFLKLHWAQPTHLSELSQPVFAKFRIYACLTIINGLAKFVRTMNSQMGGDGGRYYGLGVTDTGKLTLFGYPVTWIEKLDDDDTHPLYMLNLEELVPIFDRNANFYEYRAMNDVSQPDVWTTHVDAKLNFATRNRRALGMISYVVA